MPGGFPNFGRGLEFPQDQPPTLFRPATPKMKPTKPAKDIDTASIASTSTFSSTVSLLKTKAKRTLPTSYKDHRDRKDAAASSTVYSDEKPLESKQKRKSLPKDTMSRKWLPPMSPEARARTAEAYMIWAATR